MFVLLSFIIVLLFILKKCIFYFNFFISKFFDVYMFNVRKLCLFYINHKLCLQFLIHTFYFILFLLQDVIAFQSSCGVDAHRQNSQKPTLFSIFLCVKHRPEAKVPTCRCWKIDRMAFMNGSVISHRWLFNIQNISK